MADNDKLDKLWKKIQQSQEEYDNKNASDKEIVSWTAAAKDLKNDFVFNKSNDIGFIGKNLENGKFSGEDLHDANFSVSNLTNVDFSKADLRNVDFTGANLTGANLSGADLSGAVLSGAVLHHTNFTGAKMKGVKLVDADLEDAILLDIDIDSISLEELQNLIEYIAKYYPHKLNLRKINLTMLNLAQIDLRGVDLRGVDFTGVDFTGVNIAELDLSECIITPQQIAQALGRVPGRDELAKILAPKKKKKTWQGIDMSQLFLDDGKAFGVWDATKDKGISIEQLLNAGKKIFGHGHKPEVKDEAALADVKNQQEIQAKSHNDELRKVIEERKQKELADRKRQKEIEKSKQSNETPIKPKEARFSSEITQSSRGYDKGR